MSSKSIRRFGIGLTLAAVSLALPSFVGTAAAQQPPPFSPPVLQPAPAQAAVASGPAAAFGGGFGSQGQVVVSADLQLSIIHQSSGGGTAVLIQPALDYFLAPNFSVGGLVSYAHGSAASIGDNTFGFQVRAGYNLAINDMFSFWPRLGLGYFHGSATFMGMDQSAYDVPLQIFAPVLWHVVPHLFIGFGPTLTTDLAATDTKLTFVGVQSTIGGYFSPN
jgi:hypothetical protein